MKPITTPNATTSRLGYRPELDGLRGIAIIIVVAIHASGWPRGGLLGVDIFFTLSGFLITTLLLEEWLAHGSISLRDFYLRRYYRLFPALFVLLATYAMFVVAFSDAGVGMRLRGAGFGITYIANWVMAFNRPFPEWEIGHLWSLAVEEQFYLLWPAMLVLVLRGVLRGVPDLRRAAWVILALIVVVIVWRTFLDLRGVDDSRLYFGTDARFDELLIGCLAGTLFVSRKSGTSRRLPLALGGAAGAAFLGWRIFEPNLRSVWSFKIGFTMFALATALVIYACVTDSFPVLKRALSARWLVFVGGISYSLYLWHVSADLFVERLVHLEGAASIVVEAALAVVVACASYYLIELPFLRRRRAHQRLRATKSDVEERRRHGAGEATSESVATPTADARTAEPQAQDQIAATWPPRTRPSARDGTVPRPR
jgi:peptidoglycan/LPS O-acetylase OafA/YrhL